MTISPTDLTTALPTAALDAVRRLERVALVVGLAALTVCGIGAAFTPLPFFRAYLAAFLFFLSITQGCFMILMMYYLTGGAWGFVIRRILEAGMRTLPLLAVAFVPVGLGVGYLYVWARPDEMVDTHGAQHRAIFLNVPFFWIRAAVCFAVWLIVAFLLSGWSRRQDGTGDPGLAHKLNWLSGPALVLFGITVMFTTIDWLMSLQAPFHSTIIGPLFASGGLLVGLACVLIALAWLSRHPPLAGVVSEAVVTDLGNFLFAFLIIWAYMAYFEFMLIWIADLPSDVIWYLPRTRGAMAWIVWALFFLHFAVPFVLLLFRAVTRSLRALAALSALLLFTHLLYLYVQVLPAFPDNALLDHWMDLLIPLGLGGVWLAFFLWNLERLPLLALHDANRHKASEFREHDRAHGHAVAEVPHA